MPKLKLPRLRLEGELTHEQAATVLASLRLFQEVLACKTVGYPLANGVNGWCRVAPNGTITVNIDIKDMEHFEGGTRPLTGRQIDLLCERINLTE